MSHTKNNPNKNHGGNSHAQKLESQAPIGENVIVKKILPYPFTVLITVKPGAPPLRAQIVKITEVGFLCKTNHIFKVHDNMECEFEIPFLHKTFHEAIKVMKTYDMLESYAEVGIAKTYIMEAHFRTEQEERRKEIIKFLDLVKQKK